MAVGSQCALEDAQDKLYVSLNARLALSVMHIRTLHRVILGLL